MGFEKAGFKCLFSSEINKYCREVYYENFNELPYPDVTQIDPKSLPDFDVLTAGFPCQPFSICGLKKGFEDTRGTLFFNICKIIDYKKPKVVFLENVKNLVHHDQGRTLQTIIQSLKSMNYIVEYKILNAKNFGVPQNRERIIIVATLGKKFDFSKLNMSKPTKLYDFLDSNGNFEILDNSEYTMIDSPKIQDSGLIFVGYRNKGIWKKGIRPNTEHLSRVHRQPNRIYSTNGVHPTIPSQETSGRFFIYIPQENIVRKLTINECYRIMGFPDTFKRHNSLAESYKQIGNSVCVNLITELAKSIISQGVL